MELLPYAYGRLVRARCFSGLSGNNAGTVPPVIRYAPYGCSRLPWRNEANSQKLSPQTLELTMMSMYLFRLSFDCEH